MLKMSILVVLPIELLYEIQLFAASHAFPQTCKSLHEIFRSSPPSYRAQYLIASVESSRVRDHAILTKILRYPICNKDVLDAYFRMTKADSLKRWAPELPRRLFRSLVSKSSTSRSSTSSKRVTEQWTDRDPPLPFLRYLYSCPYLHPPNANSHDGYALTKAVQAGFIPLVQFLLDHGATPHWKNNLPILIAIHHKDLCLVRMLVERIETSKSSQDSKPKGKRRKLEDRVVVTQEMLKAAVKYRAQDIVEYFTREKGCIPDMQSLLLMR